MYPWFKFYIRKFFDAPYYWFYVNNRKLGFRIFFNDLKIIYYGLIDYFNFYKFSSLKKFEYSSFYYWKFVESGNNYESFRKNVIRDKIIKSLN